MRIWLPHCDEPFERPSAWKTTPMPQCWVNCNGARAAAAVLLAVGAALAIAGVYPQLNRDLFPRGQPQPIAHIRHPNWNATLYDLLTAYATQRQQRVLATVHLTKRTVWSLSEARASLERAAG